MSGKVFRSLKVFEFNVFFIKFSLIERQELTLDGGLLMMRQSYTCQNKVFLRFNQRHKVCFDSECRTHKKRRVEVRCLLYSISYLEANLTLVVISYAFIQLSHTFYVRIQLFHLGQLPNFFILFYLVKIKR
jgi:hypothetical protein